MKQSSASSSRLVGFATLSLALAAPFIASAQNTLLKVPDPDVDLEMAAFKVGDGLEVNLFASDPMVAKPIQMYWDEQGRLWIVGSAVYPHIAPGQGASDTITVLEDTDRDGVADTSVVFAENLFIPTGIAVGDGGVYVANSTEILHLKDTDGDLKADDTRVVLTGFGTEDTHHIIHSFRWGYDGLLYFNQSIYIHSHIETPHGPRHLNAGGVWQYRTDTMELEVFTRGLVNSWGHHFDSWGQSFQTDGAGGEGINYVFPGAAFTTAKSMPRVLSGLNPGSPKHSGLEIISGRHFPEEWHGNMITNDFRGHRVVRFEVTENQSGYSSVEKPEVLTSSHVAFRPVDVKMGPDGALYIADWYNPIIQHGEVDFRDPRRDREHGRIWRVTVKGRPLVNAPSIVDSPTDDLIALLREPEQWNRIHAKRELRNRDRSEMVTALEKHLAAIDGDNADAENARLEILWAFQTIDVVNDPLLRRLLASPDHRARAAAVRVLSQWRTRLDNEDAYLDALAKLVQDEHPRVRLEAIRALARSDRPEAADTAMRGLPTAADRFIEYALWTTMRETKTSWLPETERLVFSQDPEKLLYALRAIDSPEATPLLLKAYTTGKFTPSQQHEALEALASHANPQELGIVARYLLTAQELSGAQRAAQLQTLVSATRRRDMIPEGDLDYIGDLIAREQGALKNSAMLAAGAWKLGQHTDSLIEIAQDGDAGFEQRQTAMDALGAIGGATARESLSQLTGPDQSGDVRLAATHALLDMAPELAAERAVDLLSDLGGQDPAPLFRDFLKTEGHIAALTAALQNQTIPPEPAKVGLRAITSSGREHAELAAALNHAGGLDEGPAELTPEEMAQMVEAVHAHGDAARGQELYRKLECAQCHAIAGSGGLVGPDLTSIGGSAQIDYLIESNYFPGKAIKEGYNSLVIETRNGEFYSGIKIAESDSELLLRDSIGAEVRIPVATIASRADGGSLMPTGLGDSLLESEFVDLVRFLSELGRTPEFSVGTDRFARTWRVLSSTDAAEDYLYEAQPEAAVRPHESLSWVQAYSNVDGSIPLEALPKLRHHYWRKTYSFVKFTLDSANVGQAAVSITPREGTRLWVGGNEVELSEVNVLRLSAGETECVLILDRGEVDEAVRVQLVNDSRTTASATFRGGR